ncbi:hypothetical protein BCR37DRAFT_257214 [Protomyces lactucae-debilis]|uniref:Uncharacterized protein n=1 Tax=Protomyces lactucae-debilis TaxID=2754530 RepID=A0A1Y2FM61_PROLT|nr:uncharacterized protein BCR37DRAFT_257214 [Protomyces lactucae-debilis]ORY85038.1 hypothetical protein BCR37DRAFT_257214 [Protomyces lactucae-debilis]
MDDKPLPSTGGGPNSVTSDLAPQEARVRSIKGDTLTSFWSGFLPKHNATVCLLRPPFWLNLLALHAHSLLLSLLLVLLTLVHRHAGSITAAALAPGYAVTLFVFSGWSLWVHGIKESTMLLRQTSDDAWRYVVVGLLSYEALFCMVQGVKLISVPTDHNASAARSVEGQGRAAAVSCATSAATIVAVLSLSLTLLRVRLHARQCIGFGLILVSVVVTAATFFRTGYAQTLASAYAFSSRGIGLLILSALFMAGSLVGQEWTLARRSLHVVFASVAWWALIASIIQGAILEYRQVQSAVFDQQTIAYLLGIAFVLFALHSLAGILLRITSALSISYALLSVPIWWMLLGRAFGLGYFVTWDAALAFLLSIVGYTLHQWHLDQTIGGHGECKKPWIKYYSASATRATGFGCHVPSDPRHPRALIRPVHSCIIEPHKAAVHASNIEVNGSEAASKESSPRASSSSQPDTKEDRELLNRPA